METVNAHDGEPSKLSAKDKLMWVARKLSAKDGDFVTLGEITEALKLAGFPAPAHFARPAHFECVSRS